MAKVVSHRSGRKKQDETLRAQFQADEELLNELSSTAMRRDLGNDKDRDTVITRLLEIGLRSLERTNAIARATVRESVAFRKRFDADLAALKQAQQKTRAMIEELVNG